MLDLAQGILSIVAVVLYVYATYEVAPPGVDGETAMTWMDDCEIALAVFFLCEWGINLYAAENRCDYFFSLGSLVDLISCVPVFLTLVMNSEVTGNPPD